MLTLIDIEQLLVMEKSVSKDAVHSTTQIPNVLIRLLLVDLSARIQGQRESEREWDSVCSRNQSGKCTQNIRSQCTATKYTNFNAFSGIKLTATFFRYIFNDLFHSMDQIIERIPWRSSERDTPYCSCAQWTDPECGRSIEWHCNLWVFGAQSIDIEIWTSPAFCCNLSGCTVTISKPQKSQLQSRSASSSPLEIATVLQLHWYRAEIGWYARCWHNRCGSVPEYTLEPEMYPFSPKWKSLCIWINRLSSFRDRPAVCCDSRESD